jgi:membrane associated rhomboid family serine protease
MSEPRSFEFRTHPVFSLQTFYLLAGALLGFLFGSDSFSTQLTTGRIIMLCINFAVFAAIIIWLRHRNNKAGGPLPIVLERDLAILPGNSRSRRTFKIPYEDVLSLAVYGKARRSRIVVDTKARSFVYMERDFQISNPAADLNEALREKVVALPNGKEQWSKMEGRAAIARLFIARKPWATSAIICAIILVYLIQVSYAPDENIFRDIDLGANVSKLVWGGQWYRLISANLLHANLAHLLNNLIFALIVGTLVERQLGAGRFVILVLATGILSQVASAWWTDQALFSHILYAVGISGALFGILGAQLILNNLFGSSLPGGFRFPFRVWLILLGLNFVVVPLFVQQLDNAAHVGGLLSGIVIGWLLCRSQKSIDQHPPWGILSASALFVLGLIWVWGVATTYHRTLNATAQRADHKFIVRTVMNWPKPTAAVDNDMAWSLVLDQTATPELLREGVYLANRSISLGRNKREICGSTDTLAFLHYRLGNLGEALRLEEPLIDCDVRFAGPVAKFMYHNRQRSGVRVIGTDGLPPIDLKLNVPSDLRNGNWSFDVIFAQPLKSGVNMYAVLHEGSKIRGLLNIRHPPLPTAWSYRNWPIPPAINGLKLIPADARKLQLNVTQIDTTGCGCGSPGTYFYPYQE